ncbi:MAG: response regulator [Magnetococcales bacterium]|nr:response regulator [Magnetococcales bacterium]
MSHINTLLITDSSMINRIIQSALEERFQSTVLDSSAEGFIEAIAAQKPDLVFLRTQLKEANGLEVCDRIKNHPDLTDTRVVFLSTDAKVREQAIHHRADRFLTIPFVPKAVKQVSGALYPPQKTVLFVDDNDLPHKIIVPPLQEEGFRVIEAWDGREALDMVDENQVDLILSDMEMPAMNGIQLCQSIRKSLAQDIPFVLLTSNAGEQHIQEAMEMGVDEYLTKPIVVPEIISRIKRLTEIDKHRGRPERILVVEDNAEDRGAVAKPLRAQGFDVEEAENGLVAFGLLNARPFSLVVTAFTMPHMDGLELALKIRKHPSPNLRKLPIIFATKRNTQADMVQVKSVGIQSFLAKPFSGDRIAAEVERVLSEERLESSRNEMRHYWTEDVIRQVESADALSQVVAEDQFRTILYCTIHNFPALCEETTSEEQVTLLNHFLDACSDVLDQHDIIIQATCAGDSLMGSAGRQETGALRAVQAGLAILAKQAELSKYAGREVTLRVGVHSGHVVAGHLGGKRHGRSLALIGKNMEIARCVARADSGKGLSISHKTLEMIRDKVGVGASQSVPIASLNQAIDIHQVTGLK